MSTRTATEIDLGPVGQIPPGEGREFEVDGRRIAVFHLRAGGVRTVRAVQAECPHRAGPLADGLIGGETVVCPFHAWKFDLTTGRAASTAAADAGACLTVYPTRVTDDDTIRLTLPEPHVRGECTASC